MSDDSIKVRQYTNEVLAQSGSKERYQGEVVAIDEASGTTAWIKLEGQGRFYLAFAKSNGVQVLFVGDHVTFRTDQQRAVQVEVSAQEAEQEQQ